MLESFLDGLSSSLMTQIRWSYYFLVGVFLLVILPVAWGLNQVQWGAFLPTSPPTPSPVSVASASPTVLAAETSLETAHPDTSNLYPVRSVVDGDTLKVEIAGQLETVRLVGINTPETVDPRKPVECMGQAASNRLTELVLNQTVSLESDPTQSDRDRYGRLLRFVFLSNGLDVGRQLLEDGLAQESLYSSEPHRYYTEYVDAQNQAKTNGKGLWAPGACP